MLRNQMFYLREPQYLDEIGLSTEETEALLFVYKSALGPTGLMSDEPGIALYSAMLENSISISSTGQISEYRAVNSRSHASVMASRITIHSPDNEVFSEAKKLRAYKSTLALNLTWARYGKIKPLPDIPILGKIHQSRVPAQEEMEWLLSHSSSICIWDRFTEYGCHPTFITRNKDGLMETIARECHALTVVLSEVASEPELPCW